ncbi:archease [Geomonas sp. RF6]|uniref:archease n=1 Tax=Geomonas sp. RF6 TaxID=2897342 RepID=UPI001E2B81F7|nr:archease [Geomonas sp. RF6]UFS69053.1 archease [Geomonas sp. RF6]
MSFKYLGDIAVADIAFEATGATIEELFSSAAQATMQVMVGELGSIREAETMQVEMEQQSAEMLLFDFLNELLFYKDARRLLLLPSEIKISQSGDHLLMRGELRGETLDGERHRMETDVKAVTLHRFSVTQTPEGWKATVVLDV